MISFKKNYLGVILLASGILICLQVILNVFFIYPSFVKSAAENAEDDAVRLARYLIPSLKSTLTRPEPAVSQDLSHVFERIRRNFNLYKLKLFDSKGLVRYSSDSSEIGQVNKTQYLRKVLTQGQVITKTVEKNTLSLEGQMIKSDVVETYVPIMEKGKIVGVIEIYYNVTGHREKLSRQFWLSSFLLFGLSFFFLFIVMLIGRRMMALQRTLLETEKMEAVLETAGMVCHEINQPLMAISGYVQLLLADSKKETDHHAWLETIKEETDRLGEITDKLMKITQYKTKRYLKRSILDLEKSVENDHDV